MSEFDVIVIGGGPAGYVAAIRAAQLGLRTACVESRGALGGTCLNVGCIPSKALLHSTEVFANLKHQGEELGVVAKDLSFDVSRMLKRKRGIVESLTGGIEGLFKKNKITYLKGMGSLLSTTSVKVTGENDGTYQAKNIIIATGSAPIELPIAKFDEKNIVSSTGALEFTSVPKNFVVIGGGVIGLEMASVWGRLGAKVTIIEAMDGFLSAMDPDIGRTMAKILKKDGIDIHVGTKFTKLEMAGKSFKVHCVAGEKSLEFKADKVLVSVGRRPYTTGLGLEAVGIALDDRGRIPVNAHFQTGVGNIFAVGDVIAGPMLAHKAEEEGVAVAEIIAGKAGHVNYDAIPNVIYTWPEVASVGLGEHECKAQGLKYKVGKFPFSANGRAKCAGATDGFVKIIADADTDRIIGAHILGPNASELIAELALGVEYQASSEDIARCVHAHPTLAETVKEAALAVDKRQIHG